MKFFAEGLKKYYELNGTKSLESIYKFRKGKGQDTAFKSIYLKERDENLMFEIYRLKVLFGVTTEQAVGMVDARLNSIPEEKFNRTNLNIKKISYDWLLEIYNKHWTNIFKRGDELYSKVFSTWSNKKKINYLKNSLKIANEIMDALARTRIAGEVRQIIDVIIRKTYGFNKK